LCDHSDDYVAEENPVRVVDVFVGELDLGALGFEGVDPAATGRPAYHPAVLLKIYIYGKAIRSVCRQFVVLCRNLNFFSQSIIAIDGSKFKTVNNRERNFTQGIVKARMSRPSLVGQALTGVRLNTPKLSTISVGRSVDNCPEATDYGGCNVLFIN
jgi:hypothetical protein